MKCMICGNETGFLGKRKILNGYICDNCADRLPKVLHKDMSTENDLKISELTEYFDEIKKRDFRTTASYGDLIIDEAGGLFGLKTKKGTDVFDLLDVDEIAIVCTDVKAENDRVKCNVELSCICKHPYYEFSTCIKRNVYCKSERKDAHTVEWSIPNEISVIKIILNNAAENAYRKYSKRNGNIKDVPKHVLETVKAKAVFMINDGYDEEYINKMKKTLIKAYHPDNLVQESDYYAKKVNYYYDILKKGLEGKI